ncbi:MAG: toll/interleukin-1 receptor domain-containing protein [Promethearchaeota archaeon]|nr:MAG: toll/interleukin-1 receptor domain-containing protein [Candidatus Lokiarchaeota archaeon]
MVQIELEKEYFFKVTLIIWKFYDLGLQLTLPEVREYLQNEGSLKIYDNYRFEFEDVKTGSKVNQPLKWISSESQNYAPICFKLEGSNRFICNTNPEIVGKIRLEGHIHYGSVLAIHCELIFDAYHRIEEFIEISQPQNIIIESTGNSLAEKFIEVRENILAILKKTNYSAKTKSESSLEPWHHTWIIWDAKPDFNREDYRFIEDSIGRNAKFSIALTFRTDKWKELDPKAYRDQINLKNLSPYRDEFVMLTHAGNVIIPGPGLSDPNSMKNLLIDTLFAPEVGNVQRFLILMYMDKILKIDDKFDKLFLETSNKEIGLPETERVEILERELNKVILELNKNIIISKIPRLLFTSTFKTNLFNEMIEKLDGFKFSKQIDDIITKIKDVSGKSLISKEIPSKIVLDEKRGVKIFMSYATVDEEIYKISKMAEELEKLDYIEDVMYWQEDMKDNIIKYMNENLGECDTFILFCSPNAIKSKPVEKEWTAADASGIPIIPVFVKTEHIPTLLKSRLGVEFNTFDFQKNIENLHDLIIKKCENNLL